MKSSAVKIKMMSVAAVLACGALVLSACDSGTTGEAPASGKQTSTESGNAEGAKGTAEEPADDEAGFPEYPVGPDQDQNVGPLLIGSVYFQPIDMEPASMGLKAAESSLHIEADIHANEKGVDLGYGVGDFVPSLTVNYKIIDTATGKVAEGKATEGVFMDMNASDGPHYGANVYLPNAGTYKMELSIESPAKKGWMLHIDPETGVPGHFWTEPLTVTFDNWEYTPQQW